MFQIHKLREDWELMPTALKVEVLMSAMKEKRDDKLPPQLEMRPSLVLV